MKVYNFTDSNIIPTSSNVGIATGSPTTSTIQTWSVILPDTVMDLDALSGNCSPNQNTTSIRYFVVPSFGSPINQVSSELLQNNVQNIPLLNDPSIYNG